MNAPFVLAEIVWLLEVDEDRALLVIVKTPLEVGAEIWLIVL